MRHLFDYAVPGHYAPTLMVLLPGAYHQPEDFLREGFVSAVRQRQLPLDLCLAELSFAHVADQSALPTIHASLIQPAQAAGYQNIWLVGISIGAYVAMAYADLYPGQLTGVLLIAPYPGNRMTTGEISYAGGLQAWMPDSVPDQGTELRNWHWLKTQGSVAGQVYLSYGSDDRFASSHAMMAAALPPTQVDCIAGGHDWLAWLPLWQNFLERRFAGIAAPYEVAS